MTTIFRLISIAALALMPLAFVSAFERSRLGDTALPDGFSKIEMKVDDVDREALIYAPKTTTGAELPLVFVFHGHGGNSRQVSRSNSIYKEWPEAISVYMQGLNTPGRLTDPDGKKPGWQAAVGLQGDRDLKFFDALLAKLKQDYKVDSKRIYATGHSNGGAFTYLLWETRPDVFAAFAPAAAMTRNSAMLKPKPALHVAGEHDPLVRFEWQKATMNQVKKNNGCDETGQAWGNNKDCTIFESKTGTPLVTLIHSGGHEFPAGAATFIAKFFKEHPTVN